MRDELILHIGQPKTGTSSLQQSFRRSAGTLAAHGIYYCAVNNHHIGKGFRAGEQTAERRRLWRDFVQEVTASEAPRAFFSSEGLMALSEAEVRAFVDACRPLAHRVRVLCYVRHPVNYSISAAHQGLRLGRTIAEIVDKPSIVRLPAILERWRKAVGREHIDVRPFGRDGDPRWDLIDDVLDVLGAAEAAPAISRVTVNEGLSVLAAHLLDRANRLDRERQLRVPGLLAFQEIAGPRYVLPEAAQQKVREAARPMLAYLKREFGVVLTERPTAPSPPPGLDEAELSSLANVLLLTSQFAFEVEQSRIGRWFGLNPPIRTRPLYNPVQRMLARTGVLRAIGGRDLDRIRSLRRRYGLDGTAAAVPPPLPPRGEGG